MENNERILDDKKIAFIVCTNNTFYMDECRYYLQNLEVPFGYSVDVVEITEAKSMTSGYNEGIEYSDAKYKIYLHQDVFITNKFFLNDILDIFMNNPDVGMIGMVGTPYLCKDGTMWRGVRFGGFYKLQSYTQRGMVSHFLPIRTGLMEMEAVDGLLMATQYDLPWRSDIFTKWDFYDVSQCFEFIHAGYKVVVPGQAYDWYIHDCGALNLSNYDNERELFLNNYPEMNSRKDEGWREYMDNAISRVKDGYINCDSEEKGTLLEILEKIKDEA